VEKRVNTGVILPAVWNGAARERRYGLIGFEEAVCCRAAGVHDALGDAFVVKVRDLFAQDEVFKQCGAAQPGSQRVLVVAHRHALVCRQGLACCVRAGGVHGAGLG